MKLVKIFSYILLLSFLFAGTAGWCTGWPTFGHDSQRSGWAVGEDILNLRNVSSLRLLWKMHVTNEPRALAALTAPVVATGVRTPDGIHDLVYVAGSSNDLDAIDTATGRLIWRRTFGIDVAPKYASMWACPNDLNATPTIDEARSLLYVLAADGQFYGLDLGTGQTRVGPVPLVPAFSKDWSLNLSNGIVYTATSQGCGGARSGIYSIDIRHPNRPVIRDIFVSKTRFAGIWGRGGVAIGTAGRIYASTGDGIFDPSTSEYGSSVIAVSPGELRVVDYFSPLNFQQLTTDDLDISAASPIWFTYHSYHLVASGGKEGVLYLLDADRLGAEDHQTPLFRCKLADDKLEYQALGIWGAPSSWRDEHGNTWLYVPIWGPVSREAPRFPVTNGAHPHGSIMAFKVALNPSTHRPALDPVWISGDFDVPEPAAIANGIVFALSTGENTQQTVQTNVIYHHHLKSLTVYQRSQNTHNAILYALDAQTGRVLYESGDAITSWVHFSGLAIADGRVFVVDHQSNLYCFGLPDHQ